MEPRYALPSLAWGLLTACLAAACGPGEPIRGERTDLEIASIHLDEPDSPVRPGDTRELEVTVRNREGNRSLPVHVAYTILHRQGNALVGGAPIHLSPERHSIPAHAGIEFHPRVEVALHDLDLRSGSKGRARLHLHVYLTELERFLNGTRTYKEPYVDPDDRNHRRVHALEVQLGSQT